MTHYIPPQIGSSLSKLAEGLRPVTTQAAELEAEGWRQWLKTLAPNSFTAEFSADHIEFWDLYWDILHRQKRGELIPPKERGIVLPLGRGNAKSTSAEMAAIMEGCILGEGYALYISDSQLLAEEHLYSVKSILENGIFEQYYPAMSSPRLESSSGVKTKFTQDTIITNKGKWGLTARGLTANVRGGRIGTLRFTTVIADDVDSLNDSLAVIEKKKRILSRTVFPAMGKSGRVIFAQNLITQNSVASQIVNKKTDILSERTIIGGGAVKAFQELQLEQVFDSNDGLPRWTIKHAIPRWKYFNLEDAKSFLAMSGKEAFLAEYQHEFNERRGKVIPYYNEDAQIISWSMFEKVFGSRSIPKHWKAACGLDVGFSDGAHPHYSYWAFVAVSAMNSVLPGKHFVYRGRAFTATAIDDQAVEIHKDLIRDGDYQVEYHKYPNLSAYLGDDLPTGGRGGTIKHWQMSHEATGLMMTLQMKYGFPFTKLKNPKWDSGIAQWNHMSRCDYTTAHPFREDEQGDDGQFFIGCPSLFYIVDDDQLVSPRDERGLKLMREQVQGWEYVPTKLTDSGLTEERASKVNEDSCDSLRGLFNYFGQTATPLNETEQIMERMPEHLKKPDDAGEFDKIRQGLWLQREGKRVQEEKAQKQHGLRGIGSSLRQWDKMRG